MCFTVLATFISTLSLYIGTLRAARFIHDSLLTRILRAPMEFFDTTLTGRILNRFSNDTKEVDADLPATLRAFSACLFGVSIEIYVIFVFVVMDDVDFWVMD